MYLLLAATAVVMLLTGFSVTPVQAQATSFTFTANTKYSIDQSLSGMWITLSQNGQMVASDFSPVQFTPVLGQQYTIAVSDYQNSVFDHWQDTRSTNLSRAISIVKDTPFIAIYRTQ